MIRTPTKSAENADAKQRGRPFQRGVSGNPSGKPKGARHRATLVAEALLDGEADALTRKAVELALAGDTVALRMCLDRLIPPRRERFVAFALPNIASPSDLVAGAAALVEAVAAGDLTPSEAASLSQLLAGVAKTLEVTEIEERLKKLEDSSNGK